MQGQQIVSDFRIAMLKGIRLHNLQKQNKPRKSSCENARGIPPAAYVACPAGGVDRHTDTSENITFPHPSDAGGNNLKMNFTNWRGVDKRPLCYSKELPYTGEAQEPTVSISPIINFNM